MKAIRLVLLAACMLLVSWSAFAVPTFRAVYRYYNPTTGDHFYTTNFNELGNGGLGYYYEWIQCTMASDGSLPGYYPFYRYYNPSTGAHFYTTDTSEVQPGFNFESILGFVEITPGASAPLYRYYNPANQKYFYTTNYKELGSGSQGYVYQKVAAYVSAPAK